MISSYVGENKEFERQYLAGELELSSRRRARWPRSCAPAARASRRSSPRTGVGTLVAEGKELREFDGRHLRDGARAGADPSLVKAWKGRRERQPRVPPHRAQLQPGRGDGRQDDGGRGRGDRVAGGRDRPGRRCTCPGIYVHRIVVNAHPENASRSARSAPAGRGLTHALDPGTRWPPEAAAELKDGYYVNLGIGIPTLVANFVPKRTSRSGCRARTACSASAVPDRGRGRRRPDQRRQADRDDAARIEHLRQPDSFAMIRGGKINLSILGAMQVSEKGDLANWMIPARWSRAWAARWTSSPACRA